MAVLRKPARRTSRRGAARATSKVIVEFPADLLARAERAASELATNRSRLIRLAVEQFLQSLQRRELERQLAEGYRANAALDRAICQEFAYVDAENI